MEFHGVQNNKEMKRMKKFAIVIDSTFYLSKEQIEDNNISLVSLNIVDATISYREVDIDNNFIFTLQDKGGRLTTSQPAPGEFLEIFEKKLSEGYEKIFCLTLSSGLSGTYQSALLAKNMLDDPSKVYLYDTVLAAFGSEMIAVELIEMIKDNIDEKAINERMQNIISTSGEMFTVENLFSLSKGGRLSTAQAAIGTVLRIKPIIKMIDGKLDLIKKERTTRKVNNYFIENIIEDSKGFEKYTFRIMNKNSPDTALDLKQAIETQFPNSKITVTDYLGPVFTIHIGKKGYGISWFVE